MLIWYKNTAQEWLEGRAPQQRRKLRSSNKIYMCYATCCFLFSALKHKVKIKPPEKKIKIKIKPPG